MKILTEHGSFCTLTPNLKSMGEQIGSIFSNKKEKNVLGQASAAEIAELITLIAEGKVKCIVGKTYPMNEAILAQQEVEAGKIKTTGRIVLVA